MNKLLITISVLITVSALTSCLNDKIDESAQLPCDSSSTYITTIRPIIETHCMGNNSGCHITGGSGDGDFSKYADLKDKIDEGSFKDRVFDIMDMPMPALPPLTGSQIDSLKSWINAGAPGCTN